MEVEDKYLVLKWADIDAGLTPIEWHTLHRMVSTVNIYRLRMGKPMNTYVVINQDEPYVAEVLKLMEAHEKKGAAGD